MPEFYVEDIDIDPSEFVSACSKREIDELIDALAEDGYIVKPIKSVSARDKNILDEEWDEDGYSSKVVFYNNGLLVKFNVLAKEKLNIFMEELMAKLFHPDRLERMAKSYNMDAMEYLDCIN